MAIYRGQGTSGTTTDSTNVSEITQLTADALNHAEEAAHQVDLATEQANIAKTHKDAAASSAFQATFRAGLATTAAASATTKAGEAVDAASNSADSAIEAAGYAESAHQSALGSASSAGDSAAQVAIALGHADDAAGSASYAAGQRELAQTAATTATDAAATATTKAGEASTSAATATTALNEAVALYNSLDAVNYAVSSATSSANSASDSATAASGSAIAANASAIAASNSASTASTQATNAINAASDAQGYVNDAYGIYAGASNIADAVQITDNNVSDSVQIVTSPEDLQYTLSDGVTTGYSALHYAAKATTAATNAENLYGDLNAVSQAVLDAEQSKNLAESFAINADNSAGNASSYAIAAGQSAADALGYANAASADASTATQAATDATQAATNAENLYGDLTAVENAKIAAQSAASDASGYANQAALLFDNFDDLFLGSKASEPATDNDGNALQVGAIFYDTTNQILKFWTGSEWITAEGLASQYATSASNSATAASNSATAAASSASSASSSASSASSSASSASGSATTATTQANLASGYASDANIYQGQADGFATSAGLAYTDARKLATTAEDVQYTLSNNDTGYSALHYAAKAQGAVEAYAAPINHTHDYLPLAGGTVTGQVEFSGTSPQIKFSDTDTGKDDFWLHVNNDRFYILTDRDDDSSWDGTYPLLLDNSVSAGYLYGNTILTSADSSSFATASHTHSYLPLAGGTTTGAVTLEHPNFGDIVVKRNDATNAPAIKFTNTTGTAGILFALQDTGTLSWRVKDGTTNNTVWHSGNDGSGSGLDADTVDGVHESSFMRKTANSALDMSNYNITNVNHISINDPGPNEGIEWLGGNGWKIYESPNDLTTNTGGNLQFVQGTTGRMTLDTSGRVIVPGGVHIGSEVSLYESPDRADLLQISSNTSGWAGLQIRNASNEGRWSFMTDGSAGGLYDDENNEWAVQMNENGSVVLSHNGINKLSTTSYGASISGTLLSSYVSTGPNYSYGGPNYAIAIKEDSGTAFIGNVEGAPYMASGGYYYGGGQYQLVDNATGISSISLSRNDGVIKFLTTSGISANGITSPTERFRITDSGAKIVNGVIFGPNDGEYVQEVTNASSATTGQVLSWNGTAFAWIDQASGGGGGGGLPFAAFGAFYLQNGGYNAPSPGDISFSCSSIAEAQTLADALNAVPNGTLVTATGDVGADNVTVEFDPWFTNTPNYQAADFGGGPECYQSQFVYISSIIVNGPATGSGGSVTIP